MKEFMKIELLIKVSGFDMNEDGTFSVTNQKDGSEDLFTETELSNPELSIIGKAIQKGQFHSYYDFK